MYLGDTFVHRYNVPAYKNLLMKIRSKIGKNNAKPMYWSRPCESDFIRETKKYINNLFCNYMHLKEINTLILDQTIPPTNMISTSRYFEKIKVVIIDRDPRDIYVNMVRSKSLLGPELTKKDSVEKYIKWHKQLRRKSVRDNNENGIDKYVLRLYFEDLVLNTDESIKKIIDFLGNNAEHSKINKYFFPSYSIKNIELWRSYQDQSVMNEIGEKLKGYCYNAR